MKVFFDTAVLVPAVTDQLKVFRDAVKRLNCRLVFVTVATNRPRLRGENCLGEAAFRLASTFRGDG